MDEILKKIKDFHGHIGPFAVIGYKMGIIANNYLGSEPFVKKVTVWTGTTPPISCIIDGIQISSGCTLGAGKISIKSDGIPKVYFSNENGKTLEIKLKREIEDDISKNVTKENMIDYSLNLLKKSDKELFEILL